MAKRKSKQTKSRPDQPKTPAWKLFIYAVGGLILLSALGNLLIAAGIVPSAEQRATRTAVAAAQVTPTSVAPLRAAATSTIAATRTPRATTVPAASPTITDTAIPPRPSTAVSSPTPQQQAQAAQAVVQVRVIEIPVKRYYAQGSVNLRSCPSTSCDRVGSISDGTWVEANGRVDDGQEVNAGNGVWYRVLYGGSIAYVYSAVVTDSPPVIQQVAPPNTSGGSSGGAGGADPPPPPAAPGFTCPRNCAGAVEMGLSPEQAAQCPNLDRDRDGVACYGD